MKKGQVVFGFKKYGNFIIDDQVKSLNDFAHEMQYGKFICYNGKVYLTHIVVKCFPFGKIVEGIENGLFWTCTMENMASQLSFLDKYFVKIVAGFLLIVLTIAWAIML